MKRLLSILILVPLLLVSCSKDSINQEEDGYATIGSFERLEYSAVHTDGCDVSANVANAVNVPIWIESRPIFETPRARPNGITGAVVPVKN